MQIAPHKGLDIYCCFLLVAKYTAYPYAVYVCNVMVSPLDDALKILNLFVTLVEALSLITANLCLSVFRFQSAPELFGTINIYVVFLHPQFSDRDASYSRVPQHTDCVYRLGLCG